MRKHDQVDPRHIDAERLCVVYQLGSPPGAQPEVEEECLPIGDHKVGHAVFGAKTIANLRINQRQYP